MPSFIWDPLLGNLLWYWGGMAEGMSGRAVCELRLGLPPAPFHLPKKPVALVWHLCRECSVRTGRFWQILWVAGWSLDTEGCHCLGLPAPDEPEGGEGFRGSTKYWLSTYCVPDLGLHCACQVAQSCLTLQPHGLQPTRLLCPWDSPSKNTGVSCQVLLRVTLVDKTNPDPCFKELTFWWRAEERAL